MLDLQSAYFFAHEEYPTTHNNRNKAVIPVKTGIQKVSKVQIIWAPAFAGATNC